MLSASQLHQLVNWLTRSLINSIVRPLLCRPIYGQMWGGSKKLGVPAIYNNFDAERSVHETKKIPHR
jgi:hypothetical protein